MTESAQSHVSRSHGPRSLSRSIGDTIAALVTSVAICGCCCLKSRPPLAAPAQVAPPIVDDGSFSPNGSYYFAPETANGYGSGRDIRYPSQQPAAQSGPAIIPEVPPVNQVPAAEPEPTRTSPPAQADSNQTGSNPIEEGSAPGMPRFVRLSGDLAAGGQPSLEGLEWLRDQSYRTILNLRPENEADIAEPIEVRRLGMEYVHLPISPETLDSVALDRFSELIDSAERQPVYFHDLGGNVAGALWYLHRVKNQGVPQQQAKREAAQIGLEGAGIDTDLWLVINRILGER